MTDPIPGAVRINNGPDLLRSTLTVAGKYDEDITIFGDRERLWPQSRLEWTVRVETRRLPTSRTTIAEPRVTFNFLTVGNRELVTGSGYVNIDFDYPRKYQPLRWTCLIQGSGSLEVTLTKLGRTEERG